MNQSTVPAKAPIKSKNTPNFGTRMAMTPQKNTSIVLVIRNLATGKISIVGRLFITPEVFDNVQAWEHLQGEAC
jgi:hypothetical protein